MAVWHATLDGDGQHVVVDNHLLARAGGAGRGHQLAFSATSIAPTALASNQEQHLRGLDLLNEARGDLLDLDNNSSATAFVTLLHVIGMLGTGTRTFGADHVFGDINLTV